MRPFEIIAAIDAAGGIGKNGSLPWHLPGDMKHFKEITVKTKSFSMHNAVIMGRKTWESLPGKFRPLPKRLNIVLTRNKHFPLPKDVFRAADLPEALMLLEKNELGKKIERIFVIGGAEVFKEAIRNPQCSAIHLTQILAKFDCDVFFPVFKDRFQKDQAAPSVTENSFEYYFETHLRKRQ